MTTRAAPVEPHSAAELLDLYRTMALIREVETTLARVFADGEVPGFIHLSVGQEAVAAGVVHAMQPGDTLATTHRGHGHVLARGLDLEGFFKEIYGRAGGICRGRGGSMHVSDMDLGIIGANGIVGAGVPIALGSALALKLRGTDGVAVAIFGDGAMAEGVLHESLNFAALRKLPLLLVCENNGWSEFTPTDRQFAGRLDRLAAAFGVSHRQVDGNVVIEVARAASDAVAWLRRGDGPFVLECRTRRMRGHFEGDAQAYRDATELETLSGTDPLALAHATLRDLGVSRGRIEQVESAVREQVRAALQAARDDAWPSLEDAARDVYSPVGS